MIRPGVRRLLRLPIRRRDLTERDLDEEMRLHLELRIEQLRRRGLSPEKAREEALRRFGPAGDEAHSLRSAAHRRDDRLRLRDRTSGLVREVRYAGRGVRRRPLFAIGVAGTLALGVGAALVACAIAWQVWIAPLPIPDPERVIRLYEVELSERGEPPVGPQQFSPPLLEDFRAHAWTSIAAVSAVASGVSEWSGDGEVRRVSKFFVSPEFFGILGITPFLGRLPADAGDEVVLTESFWRSAFGADPGVVGSEVVLDGRTRPVAGVVRLPSGYPGEADLIDTGEWTGDEARELRFLDVIARVRPGHSLTTAAAEIDAVFAALSETHPVHRGWSVNAVPLHEALIRPYRSVLRLLLIVGGLFLLLATVNVFGLVAARRVESRRDRSMRIALGASERRLLLASVVECLLLASAGACAGVLIAAWILGPIRALVPQDVPRLDDVSITPMLAAGGLAVGTCLGILIGVGGHLASRRPGPLPGGALGWRAGSAGGRRALVIAQVAVTTLLVTGGAAVLSHVTALRGSDLGYHADAVSVTSTVLTPDRYPTNVSRWNVWQEVLEGLQARGIDAAVGANVPLTEEVIPPLGVRADAASEEIFVQFHIVSDRYFDLMGIHLVAGRGFQPSDHTSGADEVVVSEEFVRRYFAPGTAADEVIGRPIGPDLGVNTPVVIGVAESTLHQGPGVAAMPDIYRPASRQSFPYMTLLTPGEPEEVADAIAAVAAQVDPAIRFTPLVPFRLYLREWFAPLRLQLVVVAVLGSIGLLLASLGLYSVVAYQVTARRKELGIRKAVGAGDRRLMWGVLGSGAGMALAGAVLGLLAWYGLLPWTRGLVDGIDAAGPVVPVVVILVVGGSCLLATLRPALSAARTDPATTLRVD